MPAVHIMVVFPNAKINLGLNVTNKRKDGYHDIVSCFVPVPYSEVLEIIVSKKFSFTSSGFAIPGKPEENLCVKAFKLLKKDFGLPEVSIYLHKMIPIGAGLGGGSADATFTLKALNDLFELFLDDSLLEDYAAQLGSDCPFFVRNQPAMAYGTGNQLEEIDLPLSDKYLLLVTPTVHISTAEAYRGITPTRPTANLKDILRQTPVHEWKHLVRNDFEATVFPKYPELAEVKEKLYQAGALYASMSGSGSTLYGLFETEPPEEISFNTHYHAQSFAL